MLSQSATGAVKRANALLQNESLHELLPYEAFDRETELYYNRGGIGFLLSCEPITGASQETIEILNSIINDTLPEKVVLQCLTWASPNIAPYLSSWQSQRAGVGKTYEALAEKRVKFLSNGNYQSLIQNGSYLIRNFKVIISCNASKNLKGVELEDFISFRTALSNALKSIGMPVSNMRPNEFINFMDEIVNPQINKRQQHFLWNDKALLSEQLVSFESNIEVNKDGLFINSNDFDVRTFSVREYPIHWAQWGMRDLIGDAFNDKLSIPCPFLLSFTCYKPSQEEMNRKAGFKNARATQQAASPLARIMPLVSKIEADWKYAVHSLEEGQKLMKGFFQIITFAPKGLGERAESAVKSLFTSKGWKIEKDRFIALQSWLAAMPMAATLDMIHDLERFGRLKTFISNNIANLLPIQGEWKGNGKARTMLFGRRGQPLFWDPFANNEGNYNVAVVGKSGTGKSVFMQELMFSMLSSGGKVVVIDIGRSFEKTCDCLGGLFIEFKKDHDICINPFTYIQDFDDSLKLLRPMFALMAAPSRKTDDYENALLEQALQATWQTHKNNATVTNVAKWLTGHNDKRANDLGTMLHPYTKDGSYAKYFEGKSTLNFSKQLVVLELEELKNMKDLQTIVLLTLMYQVTQMMYQGDRIQPIGCIIDEAWDLLRGESTGDFVEEGCRRARKYNGAFITGTQGVDDYYKTPAAKAAFENSDWLCLLGQKEESISQLKKSGRLSIDAYFERELNSIKTVHGEYSEIMIKGPGGRAIGRLILDEFSKLLFSSKSHEFAAIKTLRNKGMSTEMAIEHYLKNEAQGVQ